MSLLAPDAPDFLWGERGGVFLPEADAFEDAPSGTVPLAGAVTESWQVGGGVTFTEAVTGRLRMKA